MKNLINKFLIKTYLIFLFYFLIFDYKYFNIFAFAFYSVYTFYSPLNENSKIEKNLLVFSPFLFYIKKLIFGITSDIDLWNKSSNFFTHFTFADIKLTLEQLQCQYSQDQLLADSFTMMTENCFFAFWRYGPLFHILKLDLNYYLAEKILPMILYTFFLIFLFIVYQKSNLNSFEFNLISLGATVNLLFTQLNIDLFIILVIFFLLKSYKSYPNIYLFILFLLALIKQHPVGIFLGIFLTATNVKKFITSFLYLFSYLVINIVFYKIDFNFLNGQPRPTHPQLASGMLSISQYIWIEFLNQLGGFRTVVFILFVILLLLLITLRFKKNPINLHLNKNIYSDNDFERGVLGWFLFTSLYANWDYRNIILVLFFVFFDLNHRYKYPIISLLIVAPFTPELPMVITNFMILIKYSVYLATIFVATELFLNLDRKYFKFINRILKINSKK